MYLLSLSIDLGDRDSSGGRGSHEQTVMSLNGASRGLAVRDADDSLEGIRSIEMSTPVSNGGTTSDRRDGGRRVGTAAMGDTFNPLDGLSGRSNIPQYNESESVDAVACLLSLLEEHSAARGGGDAALRKELAALKEVSMRNN